MPHVRSIARFALAVLAAALLQPVQAGPVLERIKASGTMVIAQWGSAAPFSFVGPEGKLIGYAVDLRLKLVDALSGAGSMASLNTHFSVPVFPTHS